MRLSADVIGRLLQLLVLIALARQFDEATFGTIMVGATAGLIVAQLADLGLSLVVSAEIARQTPTRASLLTSALRAKVALSAIGILATVGLFPILGSTAVAAAAALIGAALSLDTFVQFSAMQLRSVSAFRLDWITTLAPRALTVAIVLPVIMTMPEPPIVGAVWFAAALIGSATSVAIMGSRIPIGGGSVRASFGLLSRSWPIGASIVVSMLYTRVAIFLLQGLRDSEDVAQYAVAMRFVEPTYLLPAAMSAVFYPAYARTLEASPDAAGQQLRRWVTALGGLAAAAYGGLALIGAPLLVVLFGETFRQAGDLLRLLGVVVIPGFISFLLNQALIARGDARYNLTVMVVLLGCSLVASAWAIQSFGIWGAASAAVLIEALLLAALGHRLARGKTERRNA